MEEKQKSIQEDRGIADDENEYQDIRERARERIKENQEQIDFFFLFNSISLLRRTLQREMLVYLQ